MWVGNRLTPGELGLEVTTLLAVLGVSSFVFVANASAARQSGLGVFDADGLRMADRLYAPWAVDVAKVADGAGLAPGDVGGSRCSPRSSCCGGARSPGRSCSSPARSCSTCSSTSSRTPSTARAPRGRTSTRASRRFPSGHAAYAVAWVAVALAADPRAADASPAASAFVVVAIVIAAVVGASRVYLRVHYPSDVFGGLALGAMVYASWARGARWSSATCARMRRAGRAPR